MGRKHRRRRRLRILDLYCGEGGAGNGYARAGFEVVGVDMAPRRGYPYPYLRADVLSLDPDIIGSRFDAVHASPPCQHASVTRHRTGADHPNLIPPTRALLEATGLPYVIENVVGSELVHPVQLCGSSFGLRVRKHRLFETTFPLVGPPCDHRWQNDSRLFETYARGSTRMSGVVAVYGRGTHVKDGHRLLAPLAMDIDWMTADGLSQAIPPRLHAVHRRRAPPPHPHRGTHPRYLVLTDERPPDVDTGAVGCRACVGRG